MVVFWGFITAWICTMIVSLSLVSFVDLPVNHALYILAGVLVYSHLLQ